MKAQRDRSRRLGGDNPASLPARRVRTEFEPVRPIPYLRRQRETARTTARINFGGSTDCLPPKENARLWTDLVRRLVLCEHEAGGGLGHLPTFHVLPDCELCQQLPVQALNLIVTDSWQDLITGTELVEGTAKLQLEPYQTLWISNR